MWLLLALVAIPMIEIALFIKVGGLIGLWPTLGIVVLTAVAGSSLMRVQGARALSGLRASLNDLRDPTEPIAQGALILLAGALLVLPGFLTDTIGLLLLIPPVRRAILRHVAARVRVEGFAAGGTGPRQEPWRPEVIDGEFFEIGPDDGPRRPSGWTRD